MQLEDHQPNSGSTHQSAIYPFSSGIFAEEHRTLDLNFDGPADRIDYILLKRIMDIGLVLLFAPLLILLCSIIGLLVVIDSPGPIFFSHRRIRRNGVFFSMWKFRTMCVNSAEVLEQYLAANPQAAREWRTCHKLRRDPRITPLGAFLRKYSLDELPQFWNVLTGQMTLVGPRPIVAAEVEKYGDRFLEYCAVKPGITGLWQASGRSTLTYPQRVDLDRHYVHQWSLFLDVKILFMTLRCVVQSNGAF